MRSVASFLIFIAVKMNTASQARVLAFQSLAQRRLCYRTPLSRWDRRIHFTNLSLQIKHTEDDNRDTWYPLTRTEIRRLKLAPLREELAKRGLDTSGTRVVLMERLLETTDKAPRKINKKERAESSSEDGCRPLDPNKQYVLRIKGHSRISYKSSGIGLVLYDASTVREVWVARKILPRNWSAFETDYHAAIIGLEYIYSQGARKIVLQTDNDVMLKQVKGKYKVTKPHLQTLHDRLCDVLSKFAVEMTHISAAENTRAKNLAQRAVATKKTVGLPADDDTEDSEYSSNDKVNGAILETSSEYAPDMKSIEEDLVFDDEAPTLISPEKTYLLQFDGGARGNPGIGGSGMVLYDPENMQELWCGWKYLGEGMTNNAAEYSGLLLGIQCARSLGVQKLRVEGDSLLIVRQVNGIYKANEPNLKKLLAAVKDATQHLDSFQIDYIPRAENKRADQLANQAMDTRESFGFDELD